MRAAEGDQGGDFRSLSSNTKDDSLTFAVVLRSVDASVQEAFRAVSSAYAEDIQTTINQVTESYLGSTVTLTSVPSPIAILTSGTLPACAHATLAILLTAITAAVIKP